MATKTSVILTLKEYSNLTASTKAVAINYHSLPVMPLIQSYENKIYKIGNSNGPKAEKRVPVVESEIWYSPSAHSRMFLLYCRSANSCFVLKHEKKKKFELRRFNQPISLLLNRVTQYTLHSTQYTVHITNFTVNSTGLQGFRCSGDVQFSRSLDREFRRWGV